MLDVYVILIDFIWLYDILYVFWICVISCSCLWLYFWFFSHSKSLKKKAMPGPSSQLQPSQPTAALWTLCHAAAAKLLGGQGPVAKQRLGAASAQQAMATGGTLAGIWMNFVGIQWLKMVKFGAGHLIFQKSVKIKSEINLNHAANRLRWRGSVSLMAAVDWGSALFAKGTGNGIVRTCRDGDPCVATKVEDVAWIWCFGGSETWALQ